MQVARVFPAPGPLPALAAIALALFTPGAPRLCAAPADALADYVRRPDTSFAWNKLEQRQIEGFTATRLACTSQTWRSNVWHHQLLVICPPEVRNPDIAFLEVGGDGAVDKTFGPLRTIASRAGAVVASTKLQALNRGARDAGWAASPRHPPAGPIAWTTRPRGTAIARSAGMLPAYTTRTV